MAKRGFKDREADGPDALGRAKVDTMEMDELTPHVEELKRVLGDKIDEEQILKEFDKYLNDYHTGIESAKRGILRKYGAGDVAFATASSIVKKIDSLTGSEQNVDIIAKVVFVDTKNITVKGLSKTILSGILGDETGTASFTVWEPGDTVLEKGTTYCFKNCYCRLWNDKVQINIGSRGRVESAGGITVDVPERTFDASSATECKIGNIKEGMGGVTVTGKILSTEVRNVVVKGEPRTVYSGIIADDTGKIQYSAWNDHQLKDGETVCIKNAYIRSWKSIPQLNIGDRSEVTRVDAVFDAVGDSSTEKTIDDITKVGGGLDIKIQGMVVDVRSGSGLIKRCPQCNRSILNGACSVHGIVEGINDLRMKIVVDDGTGAIGAVLNRADTEKITGVKMEAAEQLASFQGEGVVARDLTAKVLMRTISLTGNVMSDNFGPSMIVQSAELVSGDLEGEAAKLLADVEGSL